MNATYDRLDEAIDQVAKRLTSVAEDDTLAARIANALPERSTWLLRSWIPRLAITAGLALGAIAISVVLQPFDEGSTDVLRTASASAPFVELHAAVERTPVEPELIVRRTIVERTLNVRRTTPDHERSLAAIDAPDALALRSVAPRELASQAPLEVESLEIPDLRLTSESVSPR